MKLITNHHSAVIAMCLLGGAALISMPSAFAADIETYANFLTSDEIQHFASVDIDGEGEEEVNKSYGAAALDASISRRLHDVTGTQVTTEEQRQHLRSIAVTKITGNTETHVDCHWSGDNPGTEAVEDKVAFVFLNTNPNATFVHGSSTEIPAEAGKLVVFDGSVPHNTQVARGTLALAGPVDLRRVSFVAGSLDADSTPCNTDDDCTNTDMPKCNCDPLKRRALRKLNEVHDREISAEDGEENSDEYGLDNSDVNFDSSNRRRRAKSNCPTASPGMCMAKSSKKAKSNTAAPAPVRKF